MIEGFSIFTVIGVACILAIAVPGTSLSALPKFYERGVSRADGGLSFVAKVGGLVAAAG